MDLEKIAFWGITLKPGEPSEIILKDGETLHITNASLGVDIPDASGRSIVSVSVAERDDDDDDDSEDEGDDVQKKTGRGRGKNDGKNNKERNKQAAKQKTYAIVSLCAGRMENTVLDINFVGKENIALKTTGKNPVHLVGNFQFDVMSDDSDSEDDDDDVIGLFEDDDDDDEDEEDDDDLSGPPRLIDDPPVITELRDEDEETEKSVGKKPQGKKDNLPNGKPKGPTPKKKGDIAKKTDTPMKNQPQGAGKPGAKSMQKNQGGNQGGNEGAKSGDVAEKKDASKASLVVDNEEDDEEMPDQPQETDSAKPSNAEAQKDDAKPTPQGKAARKNKRKSQNFDGDATPAKKNKPGMNSEAGTPAKPNGTPAKAESGGPKGKGATPAKESRPTPGGKGAAPSPMVKTNEQSPGGSGKKKPRRKKKSGVKADN